MLLPDDREQWQTRSQFTFALVNLAVGASNVCTFPYLVYENGGLYVGTGDVNCYRTRMSHHWQSERRDTFFSVVVFVAVYALLAAAVGLPMLYLEAFLGQFSGWSVPQSFGGFPMAKGIGWTMAYVALLLSMYHAPIVAYSLIYLAECFLYQLPWDSCPGSRTAVNGTATNTSSSPSSPSGFISTDDGCYEIRQGLYPCVRLNATMARRYSSANYTGLRAVAVQTDDGKAVAVPLTEYEALHKNCINGTLSAQEYHFRRQVVHLSSSIDEMGTFQVGVAVAMVFCGFFVFVAIFKGPQSLGKLSVVIVYLSTLLLCVLCAAAMAQDGAPLGLWACFKPDPWKLIDIKTWHSASRHMFYSLSLSCGTVTCLASYNDFQANVFDHVMKASLADFGYSMLATVFVFGLYGSLAQSSQMEVGDVVTHGIDFAFVGFPEAISPRSNQRLWCFAFYLTLFILNLGSQVCVVEGYMRSLKDTCLWLRQRSSLAAVLGGAGCTILAMPLALQAGLYMLELMESLIYGDLLPWVGLAELIAVAHGYGCDRLVYDIAFTFESTPWRFLPICWRYLCPLVLAIIGLNSFTITDHRQSRYQKVFPAWTGVCQLFLCGVVVVLIATFVISTLDRNKYDLYSALEPEATYGPRGRAEFMRYQMTLGERNALPCSMSPESRRDVGGSPATSVRRRASSGLMTSPSEKPKIVVVSATGLIEGSGSSALGSGVVVATPAMSSAASPRRNDKGNRSKSRARK